VAQWIRSFSLELSEAGPLGFGGFVVESSSAKIDSLRIAFDIERDEKPWPNSAEVVIWNLNEDHRNWLGQQTAIPCKLTAGYRDSSGVIFEGMLQNARSIKDGPDWVTTLYADDGALDKDGEPLASKSIHKTWGKGTPVFKVLQDFVKELNVKPGNSTIQTAAASVLTGNALTHAFTVDGPLFEELIYFMRSCALTWSIQDGGIQVRIAPEVPADVVAQIVSPLTGLVGETATETLKIERENSITKKKEITPVTVTAGRCLMLPQLKPGHQFILQSRNNTGPQIAKLVRHTGDTRGGDWYTDFEAYA
jgi:hypothetical protein